MHITKSTELRPRFISPRFIDCLKHLAASDGTPRDERRKQRNGKRHPPNTFTNMYTATHTNYHANRPSAARKRREIPTIPTI